MKLALKIDIATVRGTREGIPRLAALLERHDARATFLFTLGPHHLLGRTWLPGTDLGRRFGAIMRSIHGAGFETGIHAFDHAKWLHNAAHEGQAWTRHAMENAQNRYLDIFGEPARIHGAAGWQMNVHAYRLSQQLEFHFCSDTRGSHPFLPVHNAEIVACPQLPTTLPTLEELLATPGIKPDNAVEHLLQLCSNPPPSGHVYTLRAEHEGLKYKSVFAQLLNGWRALGYQLVALGDYGAGLNRAMLPYHNVMQGSVPGRSGTVALQGAEFLA
jgi:peptidoglycan/xylan/chitin deacetylase (PgdA/CDA1 family)